MTQDLYFFKSEEPPPSPMWAYFICRLFSFILCMKYAIWFKVHWTMTNKQSSNFENIFCYIMPSFHLNVESYFVTTEWLFCYILSSFQTNGESYFVTAEWPFLLHSVFISPQWWVILCYNWITFLLHSVFISPQWWVTLCYSWSTERYNNPCY